MAHEISTVSELLEAWDAGATIFTLDMGGLGPGYEQAIQIAAVEFARATKDLPDLNNNDKDSTARFTAACNARLKEIDGQLLGLTAAQYGAATHLAFNWCFNGGPKALCDRYKESGKGNRIIQVSKHFPSAPEVQGEQPRRDAVQSPSSP